MDPPINDSFKALHSFVVSLETLETDPLDQGHYCPVVHVVWIRTWEKYTNVDNRCDNHHGDLGGI